jgi:hypothetical protein
MEWNSSCRGFLLAWFFCIMCQLVSGEESVPTPTCIDVRRGRSAGGYNAGD